MTTEAHIREHNITVDVADPLWLTTRSSTARVLNKEIESYQHTIIADGGFESAQFTISTDNLDIDDWLTNGLGRHIVVYGTTANIIFEGFVNKVNIGIGSLNASRGPIFDIGNRVTVVYTPIIDAEVDPIVTGSATETPITEDTDSQERYGIIEKIISGGQLLDDGTTDEAEELRDLFLVENAFPYTDEAINLSASTNPTITVECRGYKDWLSVYVHNDYTASTITLDTKIGYVLDTDPNAIFSTDQSNIDANAQITRRYDDKNRFGSTIISEIVKLGDASDNRWVFSVYEDRLCHYEAIPTEIEFFHLLSSTFITATHMNSPIDPWDFRPGVWIEISDFLPGETATILRQDPRVMFAESATFTAPNQLSISGSKISTFAQRLSQLTGSEAR